MNPSRRSVSSGPLRLAKFGIDLLGYTCIFMATRFENFKSQRVLVLHPHQSQKYLSHSQKYHLQPRKVTDSPIVLFTFSRFSNIKNLHSTSLHSWRYFSPLLCFRPQKPNPGGRIPVLTTSDLSRRERL